MELKLESELDKRMIEYRIERRTFWTDVFVPYGLLMIAVVFGMVYVANRTVGPAIVDWRIVAVIMSGVGVMPLFWLFHPEKPTYETVEYDRLLNRISAASRAKR